MLRDAGVWCRARRHHPRRQPDRRDRKSTRLNSSHMSISYAVFCLKTIPRPPRSTPFPYTTLFRSVGRFDAEETVTVVSACQCRQRPLDHRNGVRIPKFPEELNAARCRSLVSRAAPPSSAPTRPPRSEEHTSELQSHVNLVCRLLLENYPATSALYTLSLHDALPICRTFRC